MDKEITYGDIMSRFNKQFRGLLVDDMRPDRDAYTLYVWLKESDVNLIAKYNPESDTFTVTTTRKEWNLLD